MAMPVTPSAEWLEADGLGGFASGSADGIRRRRYHALLLVATTPPTGRMVLVNGFDAEVTTTAGTTALSSQMYAPDVVHPDGAGAWVRVRGGTADAKREARMRYLDPLLRHLDAAGLGHLPEIASGDPPHAPAGCPFQAWSVGEALRLAWVVLAADDAGAGAGRANA